jgi:uncharacterized protein YdiU (UPF0061 family)
VVVAPLKGREWDRRGDEGLPLTKVMVYTWSCRIDTVLQLMTQHPLLSQFNFDNTYARLPERYFARVRPETVKQPRLVRLNERLAQSLGLDSGFLTSPEMVEVFAGNQIMEGSEVIAQAYAGHQFGNFVPSLGDGRALLVGEHVTQAKQRFDIQLKGSGRTPFSRRGDGRAALGPMMREYIIGEALHGLGIPTTRVLALLTRGVVLFRHTTLPGAIAVRVASSHIRIGTFEYFSARDDREAVQILADYVIQRHYPECLGSNNPYLELCKQFFQRQAELVAKWLAVGFVHGVLNTDNIALSGESIDFGPCAFIDSYEPYAVFSSIDIGGRYALSNQPSILQWNLARFLETVLFLIDQDDQVALTKAQELLKDFSRTFQEYWLQGMRAKLGFFSTEPTDVALIEDLLHLMHKERLDFSATFRAISQEQDSMRGLLGAAGWAEWYNRWRDRVSHERNGRSLLGSLRVMQEKNPAYIARNHKVEEAISAAVNHGDFSRMDRLVDALSAPFVERKEFSAYAERPPESWRQYRTYCGT